MSVLVEPVLKKRKRELYETKATVYYPVLQRSPEWHVLRKGRVSGSQAGTASGMSKYCNPRDFFIEQIQPEIIFVTNKFCEHGTEMEPLSVDVIKEHIFPNIYKHFFLLRLNKTIHDLPSPETIKSWQNQVYSEEPGYHTPNPKYNENFPNPEDANLFGLSLDMEGSQIDVEIKNPYTLSSLWKNYYHSFSPVYFAQVQWSMAMRCRKSMFFIATSYTNQKPHILQAYVVWFVEFSKEFFDIFLYPNMKLMSQTIINKKPEDADMISESIPYLEEHADFESSGMYKTFFEKCCTRVCVKVFAK